jgi:hypothetical protein
MDAPTPDWLPSRSTWCCRQSGLRGVCNAIERFDITTMVSRIEEYLERIDATAARL